MFIAVCIGKSFKFPFPSFRSPLNCLHYIHSRKKFPQFFVQSLLSHVDASLHSPANNAVLLGTIHSLPFGWLFGGIFLKWQTNYMGRKHSAPLGLCRTKCYIFPLLE